MIEIVLLAIGAYVLTTGPSSSPSSTPPAMEPASEDGCTVRIDVDGRGYAFCRVGAHWRMYVQGELDPRKFADLAGAIQRAAATANLATVQRLTFSSPGGAATVSRDATSYVWRWTAADGTTEDSPTPQPTMLDALGTLYAAHGREFLA